MQKKIFNYSESFIESIAERRDRNKEWAISAVRDGEAVTESEALRLNVIDLIAEDRNDLMQQIDGMPVAGDTLQTRNATITEIPTNLAENFLSFIMRPEVMLILTMIAIYGIIGEVTSPGLLCPVPPVLLRLFCYFMLRRPCRSILPGLLLSDWPSCCLSPRPLHQHLVCL
ncbi:MAG: hypothetical protein U5K69_27330 [Balneolaceae bacterium]|nr:hypothetical protein [Balneolaceae bacterium]